MPHLELAGQQIFYFERGTKSTPLLLIHGAGGAHSNWLALIKQLQPQRCMALDLPGHGLSSGDGCDTIEEYASLAKGFVTAFLPDTKTIAVGHSMGGLVATCFASKNQDSVAGLILISSSFSPPYPPPTKIPTKEEICRFLYADEELIKKCLTQRLFMLERPDVLLKDLQASARFDYSHHPVSKNIPAFVITGEKDIRATLQSTVITADFLGAKLKIIPSCGHMPVVEKPVQTAQAIQKFLKI